MYKYVYVCVHMDYTGICLETIQFFTSSLSFAAFILVLEHCTALHGINLFYFVILNSIVERTERGFIRCVDINITPICIHKYIFRFVFVTINEFYIDCVYIFL